MPARKTSLEPGTEVSRAATSPRGQCRLFAHPLGEVGIRPPEALCDPARDRLDLGLQRSVDHQLTPARNGQELDRAVVVRRPEPAGEDAEIGREPLAKGGLELPGIVPDDLDPCGLDPQPKQLAGQERAVPVGPLTPDELAAGDDDDPAGAGQAVAGATVTPRADTSTCTGFPAPGITTGLPFTAAFTRPGLPKLIHRRRAESGP